MAVEDARIQSFVVYYVGSAIGVSAVLWYFRKTILHHTHQRLFAWAMNKFTSRMNRAMRHEKLRMFREVDDFKLRTRPNKDLSILEVGAGSAANLKFLPSNTKLTCLDPNPHFVGYVKDNLKSHDTVISAEIVQGVAEKMPLEDDMFDVVVCTFVLCTVQDIAKSLQEIKRVLKPGGLFVCLEHVAAERNTWTWKFQTIADPLHYYIADGCRARRETEKALVAAGFKDLDVERIWAKKLPFWIRPCLLAKASV